MPSPAVASSYAVDPIIDHEDGVVVGSPTGPEAGPMRTSLTRRAKTWTSHPMTKVAPVVVAAAPLLTSQEPHMPHNRKPLAFAELTKASLIAAVTVPLGGTSDDWVHIHCGGQNDGRSTPHHDVCEPLIELLCLFFFFPLFLFFS